MNGCLMELRNGRYIFYDDELPLDSELIDLDLDKSYAVNFTISPQNGKMYCKVKPLKESPLDFTAVIIPKSQISSINRVGDNSILKDEFIKAKMNIHIPNRNLMRGMAVQSTPQRP